MYPRCSQYKLLKAERIQKYLHAIYNTKKNYEVCYYRHCDYIILQTRVIVTKYTSL